MRNSPLRRPLNHARPIAEPCPEEHVRIRKQPFLEGDDDELRTAEARAEERADVLRVREVERGVNFVEDVDGCGLELEEGEDEGEGDE